MATTLMLAAASAEKTRAAMPGAPAMPSPTTATTAMPRRAVMLSIRPLGELVAERRPQAGDGAIGLAFRQREADRALGRRLEDRGDRELLGVDRDERARGDAVDADHALAGDGDDRLAANDRQRLDRVLRQRAPGRDLGAGLVRVDERPDVQRDPRAGDRDQRARMQDLGAVVGDFGRFAMMQLRNQAGVGDEPRIGGQDAGHVLPADDALGSRARARAASPSGRNRRARAS